MSEAIDHPDQFMGLHGGLIARPSVRITVTREDVYTHCILGPGLTVNHTCEALVQMLISLCLSHPLYIAPHECRRHAAFLNDFLNSEVPDYFGWSGKLVEVKGLPIKSIFKALELWVESFFSRECSSLFPHFALHTAHLAGKVVSGSYEYDDPHLTHWRIQPLMNEQVHRSDFLERAFKKRFTENIDCCVLAEVPRGLRLSYYKQELQEAEPFVFKVRRCHLSEKFDDGPFVEIEPPAKKPDLQLDELKLKGDILTRYDNGSERGWRFDLPVSWITHEIREDESGEGQAEAVPLQDW